jgi:hypothetical protein
VLGCRLTPPLIPPLLVQNLNYPPNKPGKQIKGTKLIYWFLHADGRIEITRKDVATQTSPCESVNSSPKSTPLFISSSNSTMANQIEEELESHFTELKIENSFKADNRVTLTRWSKKHVVQGPDKCLTNIIEWKRRTVEAKATPWQVTKNANCISKYAIIVSRCLLILHVIDTILTYITL